MHTPARKCGPQKDLWHIVREGSLADVESALAQLKKNGGNINSRNLFGLTPLHIAVWRNHVPIVSRLLAAGADPDARDGESGWSSLHRALHFGHLAVASLLIQAGASITLEDQKARTPVDLLSGPVSQIVGDGKNAVATELFSWGSGVNYQLGTGNAHIQKLPCKVDSLHGSLIKLVSASKFHSVAISACGEVYTWGFGRGGRLGHPDFDIHSGQAAVITPRLVTFGLGLRRVKAVAAAKHHSVVATEGGEVFTWGSNREGQLGYTSVDTQPTPRRVSSLRSIVAVAAANKHTAAISDSGEVYTWGCNREGQLGYGTSNSASNYTPRVVEYLKGKAFKAVAAAKYHTIVLGADGEVHTWGHRRVNPRRVVVARSITKLGNSPVKFHMRLRVVSVAAGMVHSWALTDDGALFYWVSSDPELRCQQLYSMCGRNVVSVSAGKYWTAAVTSTGDVYMCDGKKGADKPPVVTRLHGVKRATSISVGETHMLIVGSLYHPVYPPNMAKKSQKVKSNVWNELEETDEDSILDDVESNNLSLATQNGITGHIPSLKSLCENVAVECLVEPRNALQMLEIADSLGASELKKYCEDIVVRNFDYIFTVSSQAIATASPDILVKLEKMLDLRSSEPWSYRRLPTPTATLPAIINSEEDDSEAEFSRTRDKYPMKSALASGCGREHRLDSFLHSEDDPSQGIGKQVRALRKKLQQIEMLEAKQSSGLPLDHQQIAKLQTRSAIEKSLAELVVPVEITQEKCCKKAEKSKKQRRKSKHRAAQVETASGIWSADIETKPVKEALDIETSQVSKVKEEDSLSEASATSQVKFDSSCLLNKENSDCSNSKSSPRSATKKKNRKGGLSMFLSGALDNIPHKDAPPPPPTPKIEGPAWGGVKILKDSTSLRAIQDEQSKTREKQFSRSKNQVEESLNKRSGGKIPLSSFLPSSPIPVVSARPSQATDGERGTPPWVASGTPPQFGRLSLRDIQMQQGKQQSLSHSPTTRTTGFSVASSQGSPSDSSGVNRWFKPEVDSPSSIRCIQIEEKAMKDLKRFYSNVRIVKN